MPLPLFFCTWRSISLWEPRVKSTADCNCKNNQSQSSCRRCLIRSANGSLTHCLCPRTAYTQSYGNSSVVFWSQLLALSLYSKESTHVATCWCTVSKVFQSASQISRRADFDKHIIQQLPLFPRTLDLSTARCCTCIIKKRGLRNKAGIHVNNSFWHHIQSWISWNLQMKRSSFWPLKKLWKLSCWNQFRRVAHVANFGLRCKTTQPIFWPCTTLAGWYTIGTFSLPRHRHASEIRWAFLSVSWVSSKRFKIMLQKSLSNFNISRSICVQAGSVLWVLENAGSGLMWDGEFCCVEL